MTARRTLTSDVPRTAAATAARRRRFVRQLLERWLWTLPELSTEQLEAVAATVAEELETRRSATDSATARRDGIAHAAAESEGGERAEIRPPCAESGDERAA